MIGRLVAQRLARPGAGGQGDAPAGPEQVDRLGLVDVEPVRPPGRQPFENFRVKRLLRLAVSGGPGGDHVEARQAGPDVGVGGEGVQSVDRVHSKGEGTLALWHVKNFVNRLTKPVEEADREKLVEFCARREDCRPTDELQPRTVAKVVGEVSSVRIVPRAGAPSLEVGISDGRGVVTAVFFGRKKLAGLTPGRRLVVEGMVAPLGNRAFMYNPVYELLP